MKTNYKKMFVFMMLLPVMAFAQKTYHTTFDITFSGGNNGGFSGNMAADVVCTINSVDGILDVAVNKVNAPWSVMGWYMANCWTKTAVFNQTNRFIEFRVKCNTAQTSPMSVNTWGGCDGCCAQAKTWPGNTFVIPEADVWQIVFLKVPATTGGTQNVIDTVRNWYAWGLANGNYSFDYIKMGDAAKPPVPTIDAVKTKTVSHTAGVQTVNLSGISIPNRFIDGLTIKAESLSDGILSDVGMLDLGSGPFAVDEATNVATAALQYTPVVGMGGLGDSIIITLKDTIRGTTVKTSFYVNLLAGGALEEETSKIVVTPTNVTDVVYVKTAVAAGEIVVVDMLGNIVASRKIAASDETIDLSSVASGVYIVKVSDGKSVVSQKITKL